MCFYSKITLPPTLSISSTLTKFYQLSQYQSLMNYLLATNILATFYNIYISKQLLLLYYIFYKK